MGRVVGGGLRRAAGPIEIVIRQEAAAYGR